MSKEKKPGKRPEKLEKWQERLAKNKLAYEGQMEQMRQREAIYNGTDQVDGPEGGFGGKRARHVYNVAYELIEGQVDSTIPTPRVSAAVGEDARLAAEVEDMLRMKLETLAFEEFNDMDERNTFNQGGDFALVEWNSEAQGHSSVGELAVQCVHPLQVIPQSGVGEVEDMDYIFVRTAVTRKGIEKRYGKEILAPFEEDAGVRGAESMAEDMVTLNTAYYKNGKGGIGRYVWANDTELEDLEDYEARRLERCVRCGGVRHAEESECAACGHGKFEMAVEEYEEVEMPILRSDGSEIPMEEPEVDENGEVVSEVVLNPDGSVQLDEWGLPVAVPKMRRVRIPYYKPRCFPLVLRRNVSRFGNLLGSSDIDVIRPQQDAIKKLMNKVMEKLLKGGSYVTLPAGVRIETSDRQLKILRIDTPAQKALVDVLNVQPNISFDMAAMQDQYEKARSALGITNSFQGKPDATAMSGLAKQFSAAQSAGRLECKRRMKHAFYEKLYRMMFKFMLAYADGPVLFKARDEKGNEIYTEFNRYDFLKQDDAGEWYWDDAFLFSVDASGGLAQNREAMWAEAEKKYTTGAMGDPGTDETRILYWTLMEQLQFPLAKAVKRSILEQKEKKEEQAATGAQGQEMSNAAAGMLASLPQGSAMGGMEEEQVNPGGQGELEAMLAQLMGG